MFEKGKIIQLEAESVSGSTASADLVLSKDMTLYEIIDNLRKVGEQQMWHRFRINAGVNPDRGFGGWHYC